jgi:hypothetical protein
MLGHASAAMTLDVYSGLFDDDLDGLADRIDSAAADYCGLMLRSCRSPAALKGTDLRKQWSG